MTAASEDTLPKESPMNAATPCPDVDQLRALNRGELDDDSMHRVCQHLSGCSNCESILASLDDTEESIIANVRRYAKQQSWANSNDAESSEIKSEETPRETRHSPEPIVAVQAAAA